MKRRDLMKSLPAIAAMGAVPAAAESVLEIQQTPVMALFQQWQAQRAWIEGEEGRTCSEELFDEEHDKMWRLSDQIVKLEPETADDLILQVIAFTDWGIHGLSDTEQNPDFWGRAQRLIPSLTSA